MSKSTISTFQLFQMFPDAEAARVYMEGKRWPDGAVCPACDEAKRITTRKGGFYRCNACKTDFTVRTATIFERSKAPLHKWLAALAIVAERPDIASYDLGEVLGLTQKTGWLMLKRIHDALGPMFEANMAATTEILKALDAITSRVLAYRPKDKGVAATKMRDQIKKAERKAKREERE